MNSGTGMDLKSRGILFGVVILVALAFLYPTIRIGVKALLGDEVSAADRSGGGWISRPISLGLDLSGGVSLLYQVQVAEAVGGRMCVEAIGRKGIPVRFTVKRENLSQPQPDLFE